MASKRKRQKKRMVKVFQAENESYRKLVGKMRRKLNEQEATDGK